MADDPRAYRSDDPAARPAPASSSNGDPLAELARLIGQTDPFGEYGRQSNKPAGPAAAPPASAATYRAGDYRDVQRPAPAAPAPRQAYTPQPAYAPEGDYYHPDHETADYPAQAGHEADGYRGQPMPPLDEHEDAYDAAPAAPRRRIGIMEIAAVFALVVLGSAGAFGYRALFGSSGSSAPPPVIKADTAPSKVVPANTAKAPNKLIYDRVADRGQDEKLVSREERPLDMNHAPASAPALALAQQDNAPSATPPSPANASGSEPKKIRTIAIRPDGMPDNPQPPANAVASATPQPAAARQAPALAPARQASPPASEQVTSNAREDAAPPAPRQPEPRAAAPARSRNGPLSLSPDASNDAAPAPRGPTRTAAVAPTAAPAARTASVANVPAGSYVQLSSQRSEAEAQAAFRSLQGKYPSQLGGRQVVIRKIELGQKGTYYRALVGPLAGNEASELCSGLKAAGGQCLIQRN